MTAPWRCAAKRGRKAGPLGGLQKKQSRGILPVKMYTIVSWERKRVLILLCTLCFLAIVLFSPEFIFSHIDHDHTGLDCPVCLQIQGLEHFLRNLGFAGIPVLILAAKRRGFSWKSGGSPSSMVFPSAVDLKIRFNT
jgi:hypothetical protein